MFNLPRRSNLKMRPSRPGFVQISLDLLEVPVTENVHEAKLKAWDILTQGIIQRLEEGPQGAQRLLRELKRE
jgi:hypothetical protein